MPKYEIKETDTTSSVVLTQVPNVVYIPCKASSKIEPLLFTSRSELLNVFKEDEEIIKDSGYQLAKKLLSLGMQVLIQCFTSNDKPTAETWKNLEDKSKYDIKYLIMGSFVADDDSTANMITCAANRGDCIALVDHTKDLKGSMEGTMDKKVRDNISKRIKNVSSKNANALSFASAYTPWVKLIGIEADSSKSKEVSDELPTFVPASYAQLLAIARSSQNNPSWFAAAGPSRGVVPELEDVSYAYSSSEIDELQKSEDFAINPIAQIRPFGTIVWGNRTALKKDAQKGDKATAFLNVRSLVCDLKKVLYTVSRKYTFEQNSDILWFNFKADIIPVLEKMQSGDGILGYNIDKLKSTEKGKLKARITIVPVEAVEDFELEVYISDSVQVDE